MSDEKTLATKPESDVKINLSTKDLPAEDRKMLKSMFLRTNCLYALWAGQAQAAAGGMLFTMDPRPGTRCGHWATRLPLRAPTCSPTPPPATLMHSSML